MFVDFGGVDATCNTYALYLRIFSPATNERGSGSARDECCGECYGGCNQSVQ